MKAEDLKKKEQLAEKYARENNTAEAVKLIYELIAAHAAGQNFEKAEALRERLYEVDPMAITEIVRAADIIEEEKAQARDENHLQAWADLYGKLTEEEANALYYSMKSAEFKAGEVIAEQGGVCDRLFFVNRGEVKAVFRQGDEETYLAALGPGDVFGSEPFFSSTVWTVSVIALGSVKTVYLEKQVLEKWKTEAPVLESRLFEFCRQRDRLKRQMENADLERRRHRRVPVRGSLVFSVLGSKGKEMDKGRSSELVDISAGGAAFLIKTPRPETARMLLGRKLRVKFDIEFKDQTTHSSKQQGTVTAVRYQGFDDYSVHMKFDKPLEDDIIRRASREAGLPSGRI